MKLKCESCGKEIVVMDDLTAGMSIRCPYCGKPLAYGGRPLEGNKPTRIELPTGGRQQPRAATIPQNEASADDIPEIPAYKRNPNLRLIRPGENDARSGSDAYNAKVSQVEARAKAEGRRKLKQKLKKLATNFLALAVLVALAVVGFKVYKCWNGKPDGTAISNLVERFKGTDAAGVPSAAEAEAERIRQEEQREQEERLKRQEAERKLKENAPDRHKAEFDVARAKFAGCRVSYWGKLAKDERPGATNGVFHLFVPAVKGVGEYYEIQSGSSNAVSMSRLTGTSFSPKSGYDGYAKVMTEKGGFLLKDGVAYFVPPSGSKKTYQAPTRSSDSFDPAAEVFGAAYAAAKGMDTANLKFEVSFALDEKDNPRKVATVPFGQAVPSEAFRGVAESLAKEIRRKNAPTPPKAKQFKRTVVFYDGAHIAKGADGVTRVPRNSRNFKTGKAMSQYTTLCGQAWQQEEEARRCAEEAERAQKEWEEKRNGPVSAKEIQQILFAGIVTVKRI